MSTLTLDDLASPGYRSLLRERYTRPGWGASGASWADEVRTWALRLEARTALDYGCGRGTLAPAVPELEWQEYDPGIAGRDSLPGPADLLVATDVLEHVEPDHLIDTLRFMRGLMVLGGFLNIATGPAREILADGRNAHLIQQGRAWWAARLTGAGMVIRRAENRKGLCVWVTPA